MSGRIIFAAHLPLPVSVNNLYSFDPRTGRKHLSASAVAYIEKVQNILTYYEKAKRQSKETDAQIMRAYWPHYILHADFEAIEAIRTLRGNKSKAKAVLAQHKWYRLDALRVLNKDAGDLDNLAKLEQDVLTEWLGFNDRRVVEGYPKRVVNKSVVPHSEVVIRETEIEWESGDLLEMAKLELSLGDLYDQYDYAKMENKESA